MLRSRGFRKGFSPVPVPHRSKRPVLKEWQRLEITTESGIRNISTARQQNIGVHLGDKYGSADVDCDCPEAITAARELLPETGLIFGRQSKPFSHFFYRSDPPARTMRSLSIRWTSKHDCRIARIEIGWLGRVANSGPAKHPREWRAGPLRAGLRRHTRKHRCGSSCVGGS
jgi:hypothetical protein